MSKAKGRRFGKLNELAAIAEAEAAQEQPAQAEATNSVDWPTYTCRYDPELLHRLRVQAAKRGEKIYDIVNEALRIHLDTYYPDE